MRFDQDLIDRIEAYRVASGLKSSAEATRRLIERGLTAPAMTMHIDHGVARNMTRPTGQSVKVAAMPKPSKLVAGLKQAVAVAKGEDQPARVSVPFVGNMPRRGALPKGAKR